ASAFGASAANSVVTFQAGSRFRLDAAITPSFSGRIYADFEYNAAASITPTGASPLIMDSLVVSQGTVNVNMTGAVNLRGSVRVKSGATLNFNPATPSGIRFAGSAPQRIDVFGSFSNAAVDTFTVFNGNGVTLGTSLTLSGVLGLPYGRITTGANTLSIASTGSVISATSSTGWVNGNLRRNIAAGSS